ncbi:hypothetical protein KM043_003723 [Ampulex compressa]|nr:hypothetical protein KM043_003723 [Ampulex compressa]
MRKRQRDVPGLTEDWRISGSLARDKFAIKTRFLCRGAALSSVNASRLLVASFLLLARRIPAFQTGGENKATSPVALNHAQRRPRRIRLCSLRWLCTIALTSASSANHNSSGAKFTGRPSPRIFIRAFFDSLTLGPRLGRPSESSLDFFKLLHLAARRDADRLQKRLRGLTSFREAISQNAHDGSCETEGKFEDVLLAFSPLQRAESFEFSDPRSRSRRTSEGPAEISIKFINESTILGMVSGGKTRLRGDPGAARLVFDADLEVEPSGRTSERTTTTSSSLVGERRRHGSIPGSVDAAISLEQPSPRPIDRERETRFRKRSRRASSLGAFLNKANPPCHRLQSVADGCFRIELSVCLGAPPVKKRRGPCLELDLSRDFNPFEFRDSDTMRRK